MWKLAAQHPPRRHGRDDGTIWVPAQHYRPEGLPGFPALRPWYYEDTLLEVAPDGEMRREISVLGAWPEHRGCSRSPTALGHTIDEQRSRST